MKSIMYLLITLSILSAMLACGEEDVMIEQPPTPSIELTIQESRGFEQSGNSTLIFEIFPDTPPSEDINLTFSVEGITAEPGVDFMETNGSAVLSAGANRGNIEITIIDDAIKEVDEKIRVTFASTDNVTFKSPIAIGIIKDNDEPTNFDDEGYVTPLSHFGYELAWQDEFEGESLNTEVYNYEIGDGCPDICGWGNNELEEYTNSEENIFLQDGKLVIKAIRGADNNYTSGRIQTKGKQSFQFGRLDIRAKLPKGQGIWPAIWMLGNNIDEVGWPACGEIDIMELVGHEPTIAHGTAHWGARGSGNSTFRGASIVDAAGYDQKFHVFSLVWEPNELTWYMDEQAFHTIGLNDMQGAQYRFNAAFFMIFNVAVGGNWPGNPDATTVFPQQMEIDYVRYFK